jgi:hypothetical protein
MSCPTSPLTALHLGSTAVAGAGIGLAFCYLLARYWYFYHLAVGGSFAFIVVLPLALFVGIFLAVGSTTILAWRGVPGRRGAPWSVALVAALALIVFGSEIVRTRAMRSGEGDGAGDLAPFFRSLVKP